MAYKEFDGAGRMRTSGYYDPVADVMEELFKMTCCYGAGLAISPIATASEMNPR